MSRDENAGGSPSIKIDKSAFERVEDLKYLGKIYKSKLYSGRN